MPSLSLNELAKPHFESLLERAEELGVKRLRVGKYEVVDAGVNVIGSYQAGVLVSKMCAGGLMDVSLGVCQYSGYALPCVNVHSDRPALAFLGGVYGDWEIAVDGFRAIGSGPARALALDRDLPKAVAEKAREGGYPSGYKLYGPRQIYDLIAHREVSDEAYLLLETSQVPSEDQLEFLRLQCGISSPQGMHVVIARTSSRTMSIRLVSSVAETGLHKLVLLGADPKDVDLALGSAPVPPTVYGRDEAANGKDNDAIRYGGSVYYEVKQGSLEGINADALPPTHWDTGFARLMAQGFYAVDLGDFSAAFFTIVEEGTGRVKVAGRLRVDLLMSSFFAPSEGEADRR